MKQSTVDRPAVFLIAQNEAAYLERALANVRPHAARMLVVDGGSVDGTPALARRAGAEVLTRPFDGDFAAQRNAGMDHLEKTGARWALMLDADEYFNDAFFAALPQLMATPGVDLWRVRRENVYLRQIPNPIKRWRHWLKNRYDWQDRLLRTSLRFAGRLHEKIPDGAAARRVPPPAGMIHDKTYRRQQYSDAFYARLMKGEAARPVTDAGFNPVTREKEP